MGRAQLVMTSQFERSRAKNWIDKAPLNTRITFQGPRRSKIQSDKMWSLLTDLATQISWDGEARSTEDWKLLFMDALKRETRVVPSLDGTGFVQLGRSSSALSKQEMSDLIEVIYEFGSRHGVIFREPKSEAA